MAENGADAVIACLVVTAKGSIGATTARILREAPATVQELYDAAKSVNPDVITLCHGGPLSMLDDAQGVDGF
jgi:predicted TIM-barrel enzyme